MSSPHLRSSRPLFAARRRRRPWRLALATAAFLPLAWIAAPGSPGPGAEPRVSSAAPQAQGPLEERAQQPADAETPVFAVHGPLELHLPSVSPVVVGFHEASSDDALGMEPVGEVESNDNTTKFDPPDAAKGAPYRVLASRGRAQPATSAVDVVMRDDDPVLSPVSGTVVDVRDYVLYGGHRDVRIEVAPHDEPDLRVVLIHVADTRVEVGDEVAAGSTVLAGTARPFPFGSQVDRFTEPDRWPHVHLEVKHEDDEDDEDGEDGDGEG